MQGRAPIRLPARAAEAAPLRTRVFGRRLPSDAQRPRGSALHGRRRPARSGSLGLVRLGRLGRSRPLRTRVRESRAGRFHSGGRRRARRCAARRQDQPYIARVDSCPRHLADHRPEDGTNLLADKFDEWFFHGLHLKDLSSSCRFILNASNLTTGVRFGLERDLIGDWVMGRIETPPDFRLANAVAAFRPNGRTVNDG